MERKKQILKVYNKLYRIKYTTMAAYSSTIAGTIRVYEDYLKDKQQKVHKKQLELAKRATKDLIDFLLKYNVSEEVYIIAYEKLYKFSMMRIRQRIGRFRSKGKPYSSVDNRYKLVGSGGGGYTSIRFPSQKHKNRWKRFIKLFPRYENKYNEIFKSKNNETKV